MNTTDQANSGDIHTIASAKRNELRGGFVPHVDVFKNDQFYFSQTSGCVFPEWWDAYRAAKKISSQLLRDFDFFKQVNPII